MQLQLRTARQKHRRKVLKLARKRHFNRKDDEELQNQRQGAHSVTATGQEVHLLPERKRVAAVLCDMNKTLTEKAIIAKKIEATNAMVAYAFVAEPLVRVSQRGQKVASGPTDNVLTPRGLGRPIVPRPVELATRHIQELQPSTPTPL